MFNVSSAIFYNRVSKLKLNNPTYSKKIYNDKAKREIYYFNKEAVDILKKEFELKKQDENFKFSAKDFIEEFSILRNVLNLYLKEIFNEKGQDFEENNKKKFLIKNEKSSNLTFLYTKDVHDLLEEKIIEEKTKNAVENLKKTFPQFTNKKQTSKENLNKTSEDLSKTQKEEIEHLFYDKLKSIDKISEILKIDKGKVRSVLSENFYKTQENENKLDRKENTKMEDKKTKTKALSLNDLLKIFDFKTQGVHIYKDDFRYFLDNTDNKEFTNEKFVSTFKEDILDSEIVKIVSRSDKSIIKIYLR